MGIAEDTWFFPFSCAGEKPIWGRCDPLWGLTGFVELYSGETWAECEGEGKGCGDEPYGNGVPYDVSGGTAKVQSSLT